MYFSEKLKEERKLGRQEGLQEVRQEALHEFLVSQIRNLLKNSYDLDFIAKVIIVDKEYVIRTQEIIEQHPEMSNKEIAKTLISEGL